MSLGLGLFLSTIVLSLVFLYRWTRDRWNWKKGLIRFGLGIAAILAFGAIGIYAYIRYENRLVPQAGYYDLALGMTKDEVYYVKGHPPEVLERPSDPKEGWGGWLVLDTKKLPPGKGPKDYLSWQYPLASGTHDRLDIEFFDEDRVSRIACYTQGGYCRSILGISSGSTEDDVRERLGTPAAEELSGVSKRLDYPDLNLSFWLTQKRVYMLAVEVRRSKKP